MKAKKNLVAAALAGMFVMSGASFAEETSEAKACDKTDAKHGMMSDSHGSSNDDMMGMAAMMSSHGMASKGGYGKHAAMGYGGGSSMDNNYGLGELMPMLRGMELNPEQNTKLRAIIKEHRNKHLPLSMKRLDLVDDLEIAYSSSDKPDPVKIGELYGKIFEVRKEMIQSSLEAKNKVADILTPEQRETYNAYRREMGQRMMQRN